MVSAKAEPSDILHGTAIAVGGCGVLIRGPSGTGKSDLALRCLMLPLGPDQRANTSLLIGDDAVKVVADDTGVTLSVANTSFLGVIEVRGVGLFEVPHAPNARLGLVVDLVDAGETIPRLPEPGETVKICGVPVRRIALHGFEASAPLKVAMAAAGVNVTDRF